MIRLEIKFCDTMLTEKQQNIKYDKYEYLESEETLPSTQRQIIEQAKFSYSPLGKAFEKQTKAIEY